MALIRRPFAVALPAAGLGLVAVLWQTGDLTGRGFALAGAGLALAAVAGTRWRPRRPGAAVPLEPVTEPDTGAEAQVRLEERLKAAGRDLKEAIAGHRAVLDLLPDPLILIDAEHQVRLANRAARAMFGEEPVGRPLAAMLRHPEILESVDEVIAGDEPAAEIEISLPVPVARELTCRVVAFDKVRPEGVVAALVFRDLTQSKRVERMRADFVANASHEIRTPLAALAGYIETLQGPAKDDAPARERFLKTMAAQVERMTRLVSDLLSLSRIELTEHTPPADPVELGPIVRRVVTGLDFRAKAKQATVELALPADLPAVLGDEGELEQVFTNLIDNAIKYGRQGGKVRVEARVLDRVPARAGWPGNATPVAVAITDEGPGISREHLPRLTERFYRVDTARSRDMGGTGLGLAIVKHIVNRHRGAMTIDSTVGKGTSFTVYLPMAE